MLKKVFSQLFEKKERPDTSNQHPAWILQLMKNNLDGKNVYLHDYENTYFIPKDARKDPQAIHFLFGGKEAQKNWENHKISADLSGMMFFVLNDKTEKNAVDNMIAGYAGLILGNFVPESLTIVSDDHCYDAFVHICQEKGCPIRWQKTFLHTQPKKHEEETFEVTDDYLQKVMRDAFTMAAPSTFITASDLRNVIAKTRLYKPSPQERFFIIGELIRKGYIRNRNVFLKGNIKTAVFELNKIGKEKETCEQV